MRIVDHEQRGRCGIVAVIKYLREHNSHEVTVTGAYLHIPLGDPQKESGAPIIETALAPCESHVDEVPLDIDDISEMEPAPQGGLRLPLHKGSTTLTQAPRGHGEPQWVLLSRGEDDGEQ